MADERALEVPQDFMCVISKNVMRDPVSTVDGHSYEKECITGWFGKGKNISPTTGLPLRSLELRPNHGLRKAIEVYMQEMPHLRQRSHARLDVPALLDQRERDLKALAGQNANSVPRRDFERLFLRLRLAERECETLRTEAANRPAYQESTRPTTPEPSEPDHHRPRLSSGQQRRGRARSNSVVRGTMNPDYKQGEPWDILANEQQVELASRSSLIQKSKIRMESERVYQERQLASCEGEIAIAEAEASAQERNGAEARKQAAELTHYGEVKAQERDIKGDEYRHSAEEMGFDDDPDATLARTLEDPHAPQHGRVLAAFAALHSEHISLLEEMRAVEARAAVAEDAAVEVRARASSLYSKRGSIAKRLAELHKEVANLDVEMKELGKLEEKLTQDVMRAREAAAWADMRTGGFITVNHENLPMLQLMMTQERDLTTLLIAATKGKNNNVVHEARAMGLHASFMKSAGIPVEMLREVYTAEEMLDAFGVKGYLGEDGHEVFEAKAKGLPANCLKEIFSAKDLLRAFTPEEILDAFDVHVPSSPYIPIFTTLVHGVADARLKGLELFSDEYTFQTADPWHRYTIMLNILPNGKGDEHHGNVSVYLILRPGPNPDALAWPIRHRFRIRILSMNRNVPHIQKKGLMFDPVKNESDKLFFATHAPPVPGNKDARGLGKAITPEQYESGNFLLQGDLIALQCELLDPL